MVESLFFLSVILAVIFIIAYGLVARFSSGRFHYHVPGSIKFGGASLKSICKKCGQKITQDSQGNWYL